MECPKCKSEIPTKGEFPVGITEVVCRKCMYDFIVYVEDEPTMPTIPKRRLRYLPKKQPRQPTSDQDFYAGSAWRKTRKAHLKTSPICAACEKLDIYTDCTKGEPVDHVISIENGGAPLDLRNLLTLCTYHHAKKSQLERGGLKLAGIGEWGQMIPVKSEIERILKLLAS